MSNDNTSIMPNVSQIVNSFDEKYGNWEPVNGYICKHCGSSNNRRFFEPQSGGHIRIDCAECNRWIQWERKPEKEKKRKGQAKLRAQFSKGFCELCLRPESFVPSPQVLEVHHIIPVEHGGGDERDNVQIVCTSCHRLIHHQRDYLGHYVSGTVTVARESA